MKKILFDTFLEILSKLFNKKVLYISKRDRDPSTTAVKSKYGFWYTGDVFDQSDIAYGIASNGSVEAKDTELVISILKEIKKDFIFYDVGSNTGWYSMVALTVNDTSKVFSFEPLKEHTLCLKETLKINREESRVQIFEVALSNHNGEETIRLAGSGTSLEKDFLETDFGTRIVKVKTLDSTLEETGIPSPDFIKIDVEGYEYKVLQGSQKTLEASKPILFIEIAKIIKSRNFIHHDFEHIFSSLEKLNYTPFHVNEGNLIKFDQSSQVDGVHMFLFLNKENHSHLLRKFGGS